MKKKKWIQPGLPLLGVICLLTAGCTFTSHDTAADVTLNPGRTAARLKLGEIAFEITQANGNCWRLQHVTHETVNAMGAAQQLAAAFNEDMAQTAHLLKLTRQNDSYTLRGSGKNRLIVNPSEGTIALQNGNGMVLTRLNDAAWNETSGTTTLKGRLNPDERLYGTGERFNSVNQRGRKVSIWSADQWCQTEGNSYVPIPLVISSAGYGLYLNRFEASEFDLGKTVPNQWQLSLQDGPLDLYLIAGTPAEIVNAYTRLTGRSPMPADWTFGIHVCRHVRTQEFASSEGIREMMRQMESHDLPWHSAIIEGWDTYNPQTYTELKTITDEVHAAGRKVLVYQPCGRIWHWLSAHPQDFYMNALDARPDWFIADSQGNIDLPETQSNNPLDAPGQHKSRFVDLTDPAAWKWWTETVSDPLHKTIGIDGAKIDFCEQFPEIDDLQFHNSQTSKGMHHLYPVLFNARMYRYYNNVRPDGGMCFSRGGGIGAQRYPMMWAGDQRREWASLQAILKASLSSGLCGIPFMCHDLAGYIPANNTQANPEPDVFVRGTQMACFGPAMQTHGKVTRPYDFDEDTIAIYRYYSKIHCVLMPYLVDQAHTACKTGLPLMRHLILEFPQDERGYDIEDQYMLGDAFLVAPVLNADLSRSVYLPEGTWTPLLGGEPIKGPVMLKNVSAPRESIPVYVRDTDNRLVRDTVKKIQALAR